MSTDSTPAPAATPDPQTVPASQEAKERFLSGDPDAFQPPAPTGPTPRNPWKTLVAVALVVLVGATVGHGAYRASQRHREATAAAARTTMGLPGGLLDQRYELIDELDDQTDKTIRERNTATYLGLHGIGGFYQDQHGTDEIEVKAYEGDVLEPAAFRAALASGVASNLFTFPKTPPHAVTLPGGPTLSCGVIDASDNDRSADVLFCAWADSDSAGLVFDYLPTHEKHPVTPAAFAREAGSIRAEFKAAV